MSWVFLSMSSPKSSNTSFTFFSNLRTEKEEHAPDQTPIIQTKITSRHCHMKTAQTNGHLFPFTATFHTLSIGELLSESVSSDDQHPLDPPEQHDVITLQL